MDDVHEISDEALAELRRLSGMPSAMDRLEAELAECRERQGDLLAALTDLVNHLPECEIELAREVWGNTNTRLVLEKRAAAWKAAARLFRLMYQARDVCVTECREKLAEHDPPYEQLVVMLAESDLALVKCREKLAAAEAALEQATASLWAQLEECRDVLQQTIDSERKSVIAWIDSKIKDVFGLPEDSPLTVEGTCGLLYAALGQARKEGAAEERERCASLKNALQYLMQHPEYQHAWDIARRAIRKWAE